MALSEYLLGPDGDQTIAVTKKPIQIKHGDRVLYEYYKVRKTGVVQTKACHDPSSVYVKWDDENRIGYVGKVHLTPIN